MDVCHNCEQCWNGIEQWCRSAVNTGLQVPGTYQVSAAHIVLRMMPSRPCILMCEQQYLVSPALYTSRIPDGVPDEVAGPVMCAASTMHRALIESGLKPGQWVVFPGGGGGVGAQGVQLAK